MKAITSLSYNELRAEAKKYGIVLKNPSKEILIEKIKLHLNKLEGVETKTSTKTTKPNKEVVEVGKLKVGTKFSYLTGKKVCEVVEKAADYIKCQSDGRTWRENANYLVAVL